VQFGNTYFSLIEDLLAIGQALGYGIEIEIGQIVMHGPSSQKL
jgi:hypothetical protein